MHNPVKWNPKALLEWSEGFFRDKGIATPRLDGELLLAHVLKCRRIDLYLQFDRPLNPDELAAFRELVRGRAGRTPVAYLLGEAGFHELTLAVGPGCLIPRPETETLVEVALEAVAALRESAGPDGPLLVLEWGTGSGAIPLALCAEANGLACTSAELSARAVFWAAANRRRHAGLLAGRGNSLRLMRARGFSAIAATYRPHLVVANPPYIPSAEIEGLEPEVALAEPKLALDGGVDGLLAYREIMAYAAGALLPGGRLVVEFGAGQGGELCKILQRNPPLVLVELRVDLAGRERVLHAERPAESRRA